MSFRFHSLALELIILFVAALVVTQVISLAYRYQGRTEALTALEAVRIADQIATLVPLVDKAPPGERANLIQNFAGSFMPVSWSNDSWIEANAEQDANTRLLRELLSDVVPAALANDIRVGYTASSSVARKEMSTSPPNGDSPVLCQIRLATSLMSL